MVVFAALSLGSHLVLAAAQEPPTYSIGPSCDVAGEVAVAQGRDKQACLRDEQNAREQLTKVWGDFHAADREKCSSLTTMGGPPSYVELQSCLEMMRDARALPDNGTTGMAPIPPDRRR